MGTSLLIYALLAIVITLTIFLVTMWSLAIQTVPTYPPAPVYLPASLGMRCSESTIIADQNRPDYYQPPECGAGLVCSDGFCYREFGAVCNNIWECQPGTKVCNGHCSLTGKAGLDDVCGVTEDCDTGLLCDALICKRETGSNCQVSTDCGQGNFCYQGTCRLRANRGQLCIPLSNEVTCQAGQICSSSNASDPGAPAFCQAVGGATGSFGAYCYFWSQEEAPPATNAAYKYIGSAGNWTPVPTCTGNTVCNLPRDEAGIPIGEPIPGYGRCAFTGAWNGTCDFDTGCQAPQICVDGKCDFPKTADGIPVPFLCDRNRSTGVCLAGFQCTQDIICLAEPGLPAVKTAQCLSGTLESKKDVVWQYFQKETEPSPNRLESASWTSAGFYLPTAIASLPSYNINFTSFEAETLTALFHAFGSADCYLATATSLTKYTLSSEIVATFNTQVKYVGTTALNLPDLTATAQVSYTASVDKVAYTTRGNYYAVVRYTLTTADYPSTPYTGYPAPFLSDFSRLYYDVEPTFSSNKLLFDANGLPTYMQYYEYEEGKTSLAVKYIYSASVDDRRINTAQPNSIRFFLVVQPTSNTSALAPVTATNQYLSPALPSRAGALISANLISYTRDDFYASSFCGLSYSIAALTYGELEYDISWCQAYVYRTMNLLKPEKQCFAQRNQGPFPTEDVRMYQSDSGLFYTFLFPYQSASTPFRYLFSIASYTSRVFDITQSSISYISFQGGDDYLGLSYLGTDRVIAANVDKTTLLSVPYVSATLDTSDYKPRLLLYNSVCST